MLNILRKIFKFSKIDFLTSPPYLLATHGSLVVGLMMLSVQCSWTPEIETSVHESLEGTVSLQTTQAFKMPPHHPISISEGEFQEILGGITRTQESGLFQELLSGPATPRPIFSPSQVRFLAPQLALAFSQATPEELIKFISAATDENSSVVKGTMAIFSPSVFFISVKNSQNSLVVHQKGKNSSGLLQEDMSMGFSKPEAVVPREKTKAFMAIPFNTHWIAINLAQLGSPTPPSLVPQPHPPETPVLLEPEKRDSLKDSSLAEQLEELKRKVEEQSEEINRLKQPVP